MTKAYLLPKKEQQILSLTDIELINEIMKALEIRNLGRFFVFLSENRENHPTIDFFIKSRIKRLHSYFEENRQLYSGNDYKDIDDLKKSVNSQRYMRTHDFIYILENLNDKTTYVGKTKSTLRFYQHMRGYRNSYQENMIKPQHDTYKEDMFYIKCASDNKMMNDNYSYLAIDFNNLIDDYITEYSTKNTHKILLNDTVNAINENIEEYIETLITLMIFYSQKVNYLQFDDTIYITGGTLIAENAYNWIKIDK